MGINESADQLVAFHSFDSREPSLTICVIERPKTITRRRGKPPICYQKHAIRRARWLNSRISHGCPGKREQLTLQPVELTESDIATLQLKGMKRPIGGQSNNVFSVFIRMVHGSMQNAIPLAH
jgi:hypothetical protein